MSGQLKEIRGRIQSINSTQQITKAMKMVSAAKLRRAQDAIIHIRPYAAQLNRFINTLLSNVDASLLNKLLPATTTPANRVLFILITSDRGLCGGFNSNLIKLTKQTIQAQYLDHNPRTEITVWPLGKKGYDAFKKTSFTTIEEYKDVLNNKLFSTIEDCATKAYKGFLNGQFDEVQIVYSAFKNAGTQTYVAEPFLPFSLSAGLHQNKEEAGHYLLEPDAQAMLQALIPKILNTHLYRAILDSAASEHGARMTAMDKASENANEILKTLKIYYNRARQAAITTELTEIVSGAAALQS